MTATPRSIQRRRVHYLSGFDPRGAAHYHRLCRDQAQAGQGSGAHLQVSARRRLGDDVHTWDVVASVPARGAQAEAVVHTEHQFMSWDRVIREFWPRGLWGLVVAWCQAYRVMLFDIGVRRPRAIFPKAVLTGALPLVFVLVGLLLGMAGGYVAWRLGGGPLLALPVAGGLWAGWAWLGQQFRLWWLLRIYAFVMRFAKAPPPSLQARVRAMAEQIIERQRTDPVAEVVLVAHSIGTLVLVDLLTQLQADARWRALRPGTKTCVLTLGQCYPFVTLTPHAQAFRERLQRLCADPELCWLDVTALIDPLCFYRAHPLAGTGLQSEAHLWPVTLTAHFKAMYPAVQWRAIKRDKLQTHFLYLMAPQLPGGNFDLYDWLYGAHAFEPRVRRLAVRL